MNEITTMEQLDACLSESAGSPVFIFKHSTSCPTSARANQRVEQYLEDPPDDAPEIRMIKVIESRSVSLSLAEKVGVQHQSPQLILLKDGASIWNASHFNITGENINKAIAAIRD